MNLISLFTCLSFLFVISTSSQTDTLAQGEQLRDSDQLVSEGGTFSLGFFSPGTSDNRYLGIWFNRLDETTVKKHGNSKPVWVANRNTPIPDKSGVLIINESGYLILSHNRDSHIVLSSFQAAAIGGSNIVTAVLLDSGNLVLKQLNSSDGSNHVLWQSFDYPTDTLLPGMKLGIDFKTGHKWSLTSWISDEVPATGSFTLGGDPSASQLIIWWQGNIYWTSGNWRNSSRDFVFVPELSTEANHDFSYIANENQRYFTFSVNKNINRTNLSSYYYSIASSGEILEGSSIAPFGRCFSAMSQLFSSPNSSPFIRDSGCISQTVPKCRRFPEMSMAKLNKTSPEGKFKFDEYHNMSLYDCGAKCYSDCSCVAFASDKQTASCEIWIPGLSFKSYSFTKQTRQLYSIDEPVREERGSKMYKIIMITVIITLPFLCTTYFFMLKDIISKGKSKTEAEKFLDELVSGRNKVVGRNSRDELQFFSLEVLAAATNNFATANKLGRGGFGPVYKGKLPSGQEVAIKRLSSKSGQGLVEMRNEIVLIAKLQHTNLVSLVGCCLENEEKMLIYEYMPNKSLDFFLFDPQLKSKLDWKIRFNIIEGIAQGLLYLHKHSRLRIIHRDLKAGNILLDAEMNPKISDFGMARIFEHQEPQANTKRIVGTYGYMSPEYAMEGIFSTKSDIFSFGVLLLEIVSGRKNNSFHELDGPSSLVGHAWELWREDKALELIDPSLGDLFQNTDHEAMRCIHVALLCVQNNPVDRPSIVEVLSMIYSEGNQLPIPKQPAYYCGINILEVEMVEYDPVDCSPNLVSITEMEVR